MHNNKTQETRDTKIFPQGNHKGENLTTSSEIEWTPRAAIKPKNIKMISNNLFSLSLERASPFSLMRPSECVCVYVINRETHSIFLFFHSLNSHFNMLAPFNNYLLGPTSLRESDNTSAPQLWGIYPPDQQGGLTSTQLWGLLPRLTTEG